MEKAGDKGWVYDRMLSGELMVCPNAFLFKNPVKILTDQSLRRINITTGIAYGEDIEESIRIIENAVKACSTVEEDKEIQIVPAAFGSSSIDIDVYWWTTPLPKDVRTSKGQVISAIKKSLDQEGIEIPFPYRTLTFKEKLKIEKTTP